MSIRKNGGPEVMFQIKISKLLRSRGVQETVQTGEITRQVSG